MISADRVNQYVRKHFSRFGVNKQQEIVRLGFEIAKRQGSGSLAFLRPLRDQSFSAMKSALLRLRYPLILQMESRPRFYLPRLDIDPRARVRAAVSCAQKPQEIVVERGLERRALASRLREAFPAAFVRSVPSLKKFLSGRSFSLRDYNQRRRCMFVVRQGYDFCKPCPCTSGALRCGYNLLNIGFGCGYDCAYCFLQEYQNLPGILFPDSLDRFFDAFLRVRPDKGMFARARVGTGEFTDSLVYDHLTGFSQELIAFFRRRPGIDFEFKTKSTNIGGVLAVKPAANIVVSWSLNPPRQVRQFELGTPPLERRLAAARSCVDAGYRVGFHFDPIIYGPGWEKEYSALVELLFERIPARRIAWISLGTLRCNPRLKKVVENRFPGNALFDEEMVIGFDEKLRYPSGLRVIIYDKMRSFLRRQSRSVPVYLCMEDARVWKRFCA